MSDIFISYKAEDRKRVQPLVQALQADGLSVWWDEHIGAGDAWRETIEHQLDDAGSVIVIWSKRSVGPDGKFVREEASRAQRRGVYVAVLIDAVDPPLGFGESQATSLRGWHGDRTDRNYQAVVAAVQRITGVKRRSSSTPSNQPRVSRRTVIAGGAVGAAAVAGVGAWALLKPSSAGASSGSIAVLPFQNLSGDPGQAYFSDGVAEEIRSALARVAGLKVVGRTSSEAVRNDDAQTAAKKLAVGNILSGSVRQSASTIRVSAELVDGTTGLDRWSQDYDRSPGDAIKIQTDIAKNVATALSAALGLAARAAVSIGGTQNPQAQRLFIQAVATARGGLKPDFQKALQLLDSAISLDPQYADAYGRKAVLLIVYSNNYAGAVELPNDRAEALRLANKALAIAPDLPVGHGALSAIYSSNLQIGPAYAELKRARDLAPGDADTLSAFADFNSRLGATSVALSFADQAIRLDPLNIRPYNVHLDALFTARRYEDAVTYGKWERAKFPDKKAAAAMMIGDSLVLLGRGSDAESYYALLPADFWGRLTGEAIILGRAGDRAGAEQKANQLQKEYGAAASTQLGEIYAQMGDRDRALAALEAAYAIKDAGLTNIKNDAFLDPLRSDPRFTALIRKMNFPSA
jgi:TolB-like protein/Tfp pilus assembly protein PilF